MRGLLTLGVGLALLIVPGVSRADRIVIGWTPVEHPRLAGYRLYVVGESGETEREIDLGPDASRWEVNGLQGACRSYCLTLESVDIDGWPPQEPAPTLCGMPDPEVLDVGLGPEGWQLLGDNLAADAQIFYDDDTDPVPVVYQGCGRILLPGIPSQRLRVTNPGDGASARWELPHADYLDQSTLDGVVTVACALDGTHTDATVTSLSRTPGLNLDVEADLPGIGSSCADAVAAVVLATGDNTPETVPMGTGQGFLYLFFAR